MKITPEQSAPPHMILLDSDDLIGCVLRPPSWKVGHVVIAEAEAWGVTIQINRTITFYDLQTNGWQYHRIGDLDDEGKPVFRRCEKEAA